MQSTLSDKLRELEDNFVDSFVATFSAPAQEWDYAISGPGPAGQAFEPDKPQGLRSNVFPIYKMAGNRANPAPLFRITTFAEREPGRGKARSVACPWKEASPRGATVRACELAKAANASTVTQPSIETANMNSPLAHGNMNHTHVESRGDNAQEAAAVAQQVKWAAAFCDMLLKGL